MNIVRYTLMDVGPLTKKLDVELVNELSSDPEKVCDVTLLLTL